MKVKEMILCALFAALIAVGAFIKIPISIVPITLQTFFVILCGLLLDKKLAALSIAVYVIIGLLGIPVFANGSGPAYVLQPSFGYLIGFIVAAYLCGWLSKKKEGFGYKLAVSIGCMLIIYIIGLLYFCILENGVYQMDYTWGWMLYFLFLVYVPGDLISCIVAVLLSRPIKNLPFFQTM